MISSNYTHKEFKNAVNVLFENSEKENKKSTTKHDYDSLVKRMEHYYQGRNLTPFVDTPNTLMKASREVRDKLLSIFIYTMEVGHKRLNEYQKGKKKIIYIQAYVDTLCLALENLPPFKGTVYRRTNSKDIEIYKIQNVVCFGSFTSTSTIDIKYKNKPHLFTIVSETGKEISKFSQFPSESEVLFPHKKKFLVKSISDKHIGLEETCSENEINM